MITRWLVVAATAVALVVGSALTGARPAAGVEVPAAELADRVRASGDRGWSGLVETAGILQVPDSESFATLAQLLGEDTRLRAWWRSPDDWRVDRIRPTGETNLFRDRGLTIRWVFESQRAVLSPVSRVRLPDAADLLPPTLGRFLLQGARPEEVTPLPARRVAGRTAAGLRLTPDQPGSTVAYADLWADPESGLPLAVELSGRGDRRPVLTAAFVEVDLAAPAPGATLFDPPADVDVTYEESTDVAAAASVLYPFDLPGTVGGLGTRRSGDPGAVGVYGRGPTILFVLPLRGQIARPLRDQLRSTAVRDDATGVLTQVGSVGLLLTQTPGRGGGFLLAGTVDAATLERAAADLRGVRR